MFTNCRLFLGGQIVEQIDEVQTLAKIIDRLQPSQRRFTDSMMGHPMDFNGNDLQVAPSGSRRLLIELPFGMFTNQHRWLPLHILSQLVVELTLGPAALAFDETDADWFCQMSHCWVHVCMSIAP